VASDFCALACSKSALSSFGFPRLCRSRFPRFVGLGNTEALVAQLRVSAESVRLGQGNEAISASQIRAHVMTLEAGALDAVRLAGWGELRRVLHAIRKGATS
jgi:hypothetical protein